MKTLLYLLGIGVKNILWSFGLSLFFAVTNCLYGFIAGDKREFGRPFLNGAIALFIVFSIVSLYRLIAEYMRFKKDPIYERMSLQTGIRWKDYKRLKEQNKK